MGINAASEAFQYALQNALRGVKGVLNLVDDILVFGTTREEHDLALRSCLDRLQECGLTLNKDKCDFLKTEIDFYGVNFSKEGVKPDPKKIEAFIKAPRPQNASEVRSILVMANYSSRYIPNYASITEPLRRLTRKNAIFVWRTEHTNAFNKLKQALSKSPVMAYFDVQKDTQIVVDASPVGISAILAQAPKGSNEFRIVAYASRALTDVEQRYSQAEREALSIVWGIEYFHLFVYGAPFTLITDHKPLECIYGNPQSKPPARTSIVEPHFRNCCSVWGCCGETLLDKLQKLQNRAARIVTSSSYDASSLPLIGTLGWLTIKEMIEFETATTVYKSLHGLAPEYMQLMFTKLSENSSRSLRNTDTDLRIPRFATSYGQRSFSYRGGTVWNKLSTEIKNDPSLATFKNLLKQSLKNQRV